MLMLEPKDYMKRSREARAAKGGKQIAAMLTSDEVKALESLKLKLGLNARDTIGKALLSLDRRTK